jgi:type I restriction enzyme S subunit
VVQKNEKFYFKDGNLTWFRNFIDADSLYIYYWLLSPWGRTQIDTKCIGSTQKALTIETLLRFDILLPPFPEQHAIAATLSCLDDKIELNNKINANLEAQAQAIFKSWFVDFEPFQDGEFVDSELGLIPKGWRVGALSEIADITMGQSPSGKSYNEDSEGIVFYQGRAEFGWRFPTIRLYTTEPKRMAKENDILMSIRAPVGDINIATEDCCIGRGLAAVHSKAGMQSYILYLLMNLQPQFDAYNGEGTVFGSINQKAFNTMKTIIPSEEAIKDYEAVCNVFDTQIRALCDQNRTLATLRDTLLPKLMSGEIEVH